MRANLHARASRCSGGGGGDLCGLACAACRIVFVAHALAPHSAASRADEARARPAGHKSGTRGNPVLEVPTAAGGRTDGWRGESAQPLDLGGQGGERVPGKSQLADRRDGNAALEEVFEPLQPARGHCHMQPPQPPPWRYHACTTDTPPARCAAWQGVTRPVTTFQSGRCGITSGRYQPVAGW